MFQQFSITHVEFLLQSAIWTLALSGIALVGGGILGAVIALLRVSVFPALRWLIRAYI